MSTTHDPSGGRSSSSEGDPGSEGRTGEGSGADQDRSAAERMRDGAMARTAQGRDLAARKARALRGTTAGLASGSAAGATAGRGGQQGAQRTATAGGAPGSRPGGSAPRPGGQRPASRPPRRGAPRRVRLTAQRIDPWSVLKISFLVSVALGIAGVVMVAVLWTVLSGMNVFSTVNEFLAQVTSGETGGPSINLEDYLGFTRVTALAAVLGILNVFLLTALATLTAFLYNICAALVGGAQLTLSDE
ncbi:DUF3566 domain-containing protein [Ornithinimicrobium sufpigmenti]|uniref:DUF3566 domain-containing protein n=1 Tax=Ornithinimicrobium sufpigmenti TaxID=2508882 RepID=UPI001EDF3D99|nr:MULTISPECIES: DUF3566 domain-containing protein [unclassified Ornithinimicrobium]